MERGGLILGPMPLYNGKIKFFFFLLLAIYFSKRGRKYLLTDNKENGFGH